MSQELESRLADLGELEERREGKTQERRAFIVIVFYGTYYSDFLTYNRYRKILSWV